jgi:IS5 family transposase
MIDMRHPLAVLATRMPWAQIEASIAPHLQCKVFKALKVKQPSQTQQMTLL